MLLKLTNYFHRSKVDHLKIALDDVDTSLFGVEQTLYSVQKQYGDPVQAGGKSIQEFEVIRNCLLSILADINTLVAI